MYPKPFPKSWVSQELFNDYIKLKREIINIQYDINCQKMFYKESDKLKKQLDTKINELLKLLDQMRIEGFKHEDLILLSLNVEVYTRINE